MPGNDKRPWRHLYNTKQWYRLRAAQLRDEPLCRMCHQMGRISPATVVDHIIPHKGDEELFFNGELASLCKFCHDSTKQKLEKTGILAGHNVDGTPHDRNHHWNKS